MAVDANGMPLRVIVTEGTRADCKEAINLIKNTNTKVLFADRGYDTNEIINYAKQNNIEIVIPSKRNRKEQREYNSDLYKKRHLVENAFLHLKRWRGIATRYCKTLDSFIASIHVRCIALWLKVLA